MKLEWIMLEIPVAALKVIVKIVGGTRFQFKIVKDMSRPGHLRACPLNSVQRSLEGALEGAL